jgi:hypothetical protein
VLIVDPCSSLEYVLRTCPHKFIKVCVVLCSFLEFLDTELIVGMMLEHMHFYSAKGKVKIKLFAKF